VSDDSLDAALAYMDSHPECGVLGTHLVGRDGTPQPNCRYFPTIANIFVARSGLARAFPRLRMVDPPDALRYPSVATECDWVTGCFMLIRRDVVAATGLFDPRYFLYFEEVDFCLNAKRRGWKIVYLPTTRVVHLGGESAKSDAQLSESGQISVLQIESELLYIRKHFGRAGLLAHVCLCELADAMRACKSMLKRRALTGLAGISAQARNRRRILAETRWGTRPTR
jgi:GT2 family glycosyltransferase